MMIKTDSLWRSVPHVPRTLCIFDLSSDSSYFLSASSEARSQRNKRSFITSFHDDKLADAWNLANFSR